MEVTNDLYIYIYMYIYIYIWDIILPHLMLVEHKPSNNFHTHI